MELFPKEIRREECAILLKCLPIHCKAGRCNVLLFTKYQDSGEFYQYEVSGQWGILSVH